MLRSIRRLTTVALTGAVLASSACDLTGPALSENPNNPTPGSATPTQLFVAFQAEQFLMFSETEAFTICIWMQQCTATNGRFLEQQGVFYQFDPLTFSLQFLLN